MKKINGHGAAEEFLPGNAGNDGFFFISAKTGDTNSAASHGNNMASSTMASAAAQPIQIRVLAANTGATYPISLHPNELRCVFLLCWFVSCFVWLGYGPL